MGGLTEEQKRRIEENRQKALQKRAQNLATKQTTVPEPNKLPGNMPTANKYTGTSQKPVYRPSNNTHNVPRAFIAPPPLSVGCRVGRTSPVKSIGMSKTLEKTTANNKQVPTWTGLPRTGSTSTTNPTTSMGTKVAFSGGTVKHFPISNTISNNQANIPGQSSTDKSNFNATVNKSNEQAPASKSTLHFYAKSCSSNATYKGSSSNSTAYQQTISGASKKSVSSFYPKSSSSANKNTFSSLSYKNNNGNYMHNPNKPQGQWQKAQGFGSKEKPYGESIAGSMSGATAFSGGLSGKCVLISKKRFLVDVVFHAKLIEIFKQMSTKSYDPVTKNWSFDLSEYDELVQAMKSLRPAVDIEPLPKSVCNIFRSQRRGFDKPEHIPDANLNSVDSKLVNSLMPFQREGVNFAVHHEGKVLIADEMGLGKTIQAVCVACYYQTEWPLLIVSPSSLRYQWAEALLKWLPSLDPGSVNVVLTGKDNATEGLVNIMSYDLMSRKVDMLTKVGFQIIILDESHFMKNIKSARSRAALAIVKNAARVILLSGTPALSRPSELFTQIKAVQPKLFSANFHDFGIRYCDGKQNPWGWDYSGSSNLSELQLILQETVMIRRMKDDVLTQLPSKTRQMVLLDPQSVKTGSNALKSAAKEMTKGKSSNEQRGALMQYFNETGVSKIQAVKDYVSDLLESGLKMLVFAHHQIVLNAICECVAGKKQDYIRIDGSTSAIKRKEQCDHFQATDDCRVAVLSITAANAGLTLTAASLVVFAELFWNPGIMIQAEDRVHRIGQKDCVNIHYLIAKGTADDYIWPLVQKKLSVLEKAGLSKDDFSDADTTTFEDPRQTKTLSFFEQSFFEKDDTNELVELAALEAAEADGIASRPCHEYTSDCSKLRPEGRSMPSASITSYKEKHPVKTNQGRSSCQFDKDKLLNTKHTEIKRLAKSTQRKLDKWRKVSSEELVDKQTMEDFAEDLVTECFDPNMATLDGEDSDRDSQSILDLGVSEVKRKCQTSLLSGTHSLNVCVPPSKKQRHL